MAGFFLAYAKKCPISTKHNSKSHKAGQKIIATFAFIDVRIEIVVLRFGSI